MIHYFKFTIAIFNINYQTLIFIEKMRFLYFSNNSNPSCIANHFFFIFSKQIFQVFFGTNLDKKWMKIRKKKDCVWHKCDRIFHFKKYCQSIEKRCQVCQLSCFVLCDVWTWKNAGRWRVLEERIFYFVLRLD